MESQPPTDAELVAQSLAGNREAFGQLYDRYARIVASVAAGVSGDWPAVDDMLQESFLRAFRRLNTLRDPARFAVWIVAIARQVGRERRRSHRRERHQFRDPVDLKVESSASPQVKIQAFEELQHVMRELSKLSETERMAIHMYYLNEQRAAESAELLGLSRSGFYAALQRAIARLAARVQASDPIDRRVP